MLSSKTPTSKTPTKQGNRKIEKRKLSERARDWLRKDSIPQLKRAASRTAQFLKLCYIDGMKALIAGKYDTRQACIIITATTPVLLSMMILFVPLTLFPTPEHRAFYHFADTLAHDSISMIPVFLGAISTTLGLKIPLA